MKAHPCFLRAGILAALLAAATPVAFGRNAIIFVADGLRHGSVNPTDAPTMADLRTKGVDFQNSHALFPTFTTPNASAIATGHFLGDTGDFSNTIYPGFAIPPRSGVNQVYTVTPFIENDAVIGCIDDHFQGNYLDEQTLLQFARENGYLTAAVGKLGPTVIQDASEASNPTQVPRTVIIDDSTGRLGGLLLNPKIAEALKAASLSFKAPDRSNGKPTTQENNGNPGNCEQPGTLAPNTVQQKYFADCLTKAVLPEFVCEKKPFVVVFWSRDPDGTQHNQGDSLNRPEPGINGPTSKGAVRNADDNLKQILEYLQTAGLADDTDVFVTSDHGFSTISRHEVDSANTVSQSFSASLTCRDASGKLEVPTGFLPPGFVAIDLAKHLNLPLYDPDKFTIRDGAPGYALVRLDGAQPGEGEENRPAYGNGVLGGSGTVKDPTDSKVLVASNGGSDLIYLPDHDPSRLKQVVEFLSNQDYVSGIFTHSRYGNVPGALSLRDIYLEGGTHLPTPDVVISFRSFATNPQNPLQNAVTVCDTGLQEGQGMHGSFNRADTLNNMIALGPDFKKGWIDSAPVSNADVNETVAHVLKLKIPAHGALLGRIIEESLQGGPEKMDFVGPANQDSQPTDKGVVTRLIYQRVGDVKYFTAAGFPGKAVGVPGESEPKGAK
jgi:Type I phosphodiesterase / nucleotide pyrophosphatase